MSDLINPFNYAILPKLTKRLFIGILLYILEVNRGKLCYLKFYLGNLKLFKCTIGLIIF